VATGYLLDYFFPETASADVAQWMAEITPASAPIYIMLAVVAAPLSEELVFRRLLVLSARPGRYKVAAASVLSSALWAVIHLYSWPTTGLMFLEGLFLCWLALKYKSIWPGIAFHALYNAYAMWGLLTYPLPQPA
jgi:uncharacterized protein